MDEVHVLRSGILLLPNLVPEIKRLRVGIELNVYSTLC